MIHVVNHRHKEMHVETFTIFYWCRISVCNTFPRSVISPGSTLEIGYLQRIQYTDIDIYTFNVHIWL